MSADTLIDSDQLLDEKYNAYLKSKAALEAYDEAKKKWYESLNHKPGVVALVQQMFYLGYPKRKKDDAWRGEGVIEALRRRPGCYPLARLSAIIDRWGPGVCFCYGFQHKVKGTAFTVPYFEKTIRANSWEGVAPTLDVIEDCVIPCLHLPPNHRVLVTRADRINPYDPARQTYALWAPELTSRPAEIILPETLINRIYWADNPKTARVYRKTEAV